MKRIAIVEDNADNRLLLDAILSDDYALTEYGTGIEALEGIKKHPPNLVLLDISLPGMDGTEVLANLRQIDTFKSLPIIALTAHAMSGDREKYLAAGFNEYVSKPIVDEDILFQAINSLI